MENIELSPRKKAKRTGQWAKIMTKWLITYTNADKKWNFVSFEGAKGGESKGIVDFLAIRRDRKTGDYFEVIIIQVKGGSSPMPTKKEILRLSKVGEYYHAKRIILSNWQKGKPPILYCLVNTSWEKIEPKEAFS
jgi:hypothetical protein